MTLRHRGRRVFVDTTHSAEIEIKGYQVPDAQLALAADRLAAMPVGPDDLVAGDVRVREIDGYDYLYFIGVNDDAAVVTIGSVVPHDSARSAEVLKKLGKVAIFRGSFGV